MSWRPVYLFICGLLLAGIVHIAVILTIPLVGTKDASDQLTRSQELWEFVTLDNEGNTRVADIDPYFDIGACRFDLKENALLVSGPLTDAFWSASVFDAEGQIIYSLNRRTAIGSQLSILVVNPVQMSNLRETQPDELESSILVELRGDQGFLVLRVLSPDATWKASTDAFMQSINCQRFDIQ